MATPSRLIREELYAHKKFVGSMLDYIIKDFENSRVRFDDNTIGAMVVCDSSDQARKMFKQFEKRSNEHKLTSILILYITKTARKSQHSHKSFP